MPLTKTLPLGLIIIILALFSSLISLGRPVPLPALAIDPSYLKEIEKWRNERLEEINGETGWNTLLGLFWLHEGKNRFGSDPSNDIVLPRIRAPKLAGSLHLDNGTVRLTTRLEVGITSEGSRVSDLVLRPDADGLPTPLKLGSLTMFVIKRGDRFGLRIKDKLHPARTNFKGLSYFPIDINWRVQGKLEAYAPPKIIPIVNVLAMVDNMTSPGALVFEVRGKEYRLDAVLEKSSKQLFVIFADQTSGKETYGAGRYLYLDPPDADGKVTIDFNKAYNPPCAFTKFATCPLPPRQNRLAIRIDAGEKRYAGSGH
ncbi:MAG TPA: DUF1684 domain-containing protein [Blastocatellia bacterium]|nr:DUF1684 domain-containing protein [Blastocatellia bacterium]